MAEFAVLIDGADPLVEEPPLCSLLLRILSFNLKHQMCAILKPHEEVGTKFVDGAVVRIENLESQMIVLSPRLHNVGMVECVKGKSASHAGARPRLPPWERGIELV